MHKGKLDIRATCDACATVNINAPVNIKRSMARKHTAPGCSDIIWWVHVPVDATISDAVHSPVFSHDESILKNMLAQESES